MARSAKELKIAIAGAGMGGLSTALALAKAGFTDITVFETASNLGFVGAGIQLAPNMAKILDRLGCWPDIEKEAVDLLETDIVEGSSDTILRNVDLHFIRGKYGYPHMVGHRSSLAGSMFEHCKKEKAIKFNFATSIDSITSYSPRPKFTAVPREGEPYPVECDVFLAADGIKSQTRDHILKQLGIDHAKVIDTNQAAYRIMLRREDMQHDPELLALLDGEKVTRWIGEKRHIIAYPVSSKQIYNMSTVQPDINFASAPSATYTTRGSKAVMLKVFGDFCPRVQKLLNLVPEGEVCEWKLRVHTPLPAWVHGSVALVGDACHPTLPHLAQGAAQAIEDGAVLSTVLSLLPASNLTPESINRALKIYEYTRKERAETLIEIAAESGRNLHLGSGKAKEERDKAFADKNAPVSDRWADPKVQEGIYSWDAFAVAERNVRELWDSEEIKSGQGVIANGAA